MNQDQFGTQPIKSIFLKVAIPSVITMLFASIHMVIDGVFMGKYIGSDALAAVNVIMPCMMILFAVVDLVASGSGVRIGVLFGENKNDDASRIFSASSLAILLISLLLMLVLYLFLEPLIFSLISDQDLAKLSYAYASTYIPFIPIILPLFALDNYLLACGKAKQSMWINIFVSILNICLNTWFIAYLRLGIEYSAMSTAISMSVGSLLSLYPFLMKQLELKFVRPTITFEEVKTIVYNGTSQFFGSISFSAMAIVTNAFLLHLGGAVAVSALAIVMYIEAMLMPITMGVASSVQPVISYNYGAKKYRRVILLYRLVSLVVFIISATAVSIIMLMPDQLINLFSKSEDKELQALAKTALLLYSPLFLFVWYNMVSSTFMRALEKPAKALAIMMLDSVIFPLLFMAILSIFMGVKGIFIAQTVGTFLTMVVAIFLWRGVEKELKR